MLSDVTFGQYYPVSSPIHKMDARAKILLLIAYIVLIFLVKDFIGFLAIGVLLITMILLSRVPLLTILKSMKAIIFLIVITFIFNLFFYDAGENATVLFWIIKKDSLMNATFIALRLIILVMGSSILTLTTTPVNLTDGIESLLSPLKVVHFPVHDIALIMSIALRFIPTLLRETDRIILAQKSRGADFDSGNIVKKTKAMIPVLIPLLVSAFRRADELGDAMDARCYTGSTNRTKYKKLKYTYRDFVGLVVIVAFYVGVILINNLL